jgi:DNA helicase-2/ATP-dependent DNA helicase PcrA
MAPARYPAPLPPADHPPGPSRLQRRVIEFVRHGSGNGVIRATAGAGKTSTLVQVAEHLPPGLQACFLAFGRDAARELGLRLPAGLPAMTVHRLGRTTLQNALAGRGVRLRPVEAGKYRRLTRRELAVWYRQGGCEPTTPGGAPEALAGSEEFLVGLAQLARLDLVDSDDDAALRQLGLRHGLVPPAEEERESCLYERLRRILRRGLLEVVEDGTCDFTDMLYGPLILDLPPPRFDFVCVDEAQDYSAAALDFTMRLIEPRAGGRLLFVGDPNQGIYGFAGAESNALERIESAAGATTLPLSITYRCPRSHVELARLISPEIEAGPNAPAGRVFWIVDGVLEHWVRAGDLVLCRANAPLVKACLRLVRAGRPAAVLGRDLASRLADLAGRVLPEGLVDAEARLATMTYRELVRLREARPGRSSGRAFVSERLDLIDCLRFLCADLRSPGRATAPGHEPLGLGALLERIEAVFGQRNRVVTLSTVHRAKGKEADRVFILYPELMPAPYARSAEALRGEACVQFVALTRARRDLVFVSEPGNLPIGMEIPALDGALGGSGWLRVLERALALSRQRGRGDR